MGRKAAHRTDRRAGAASNEHITGTNWPSKEMRNDRLRECVDIIRALLRGEEVSHDGLVRVDRARLWTRPPDPPRLLGAAVSVATARWCAAWADGLITVNADLEHLRRLIDAYRAAGGRGPLHLQVHLSWAPEEAQAEAIAHEQWRSNVFPPPACWDIDSVEIFDAVSQDVPIERVRQVVQISSDLGWHTAQLATYAELGFDEIALHHVGQGLDDWIEIFGAKVLPQLRQASTAGTR
jgi:G6PDH family F420-dependent oxidoreductase